MPGDRPMQWRSTLVYLIGTVGALGAAFLLALLVAIGMGADERGGTVALWLVLPAWVSFGYVFFLQRELKRLLERVLLTLALEAFALPLAGLAFAGLLWVRSFDPVGEQTVVMGQATGLIVGGLGVVLGTGLVAVVVGGLSVLLFLLLKFNLVHVGRAISLEARRWMGEGTVVPLILVGILGVLFIVGAAPAQTSLPGTPPTERRFPGIWTQPFYCPCLAGGPLYQPHRAGGARRPASSGPIQGSDPRGVWSRDPAGSSRAPGRPPPARIVRVQHRQPEPSGR